MDKQTVTQKEKTELLATIRKDAAFNRALQRRYSVPRGFSDSREWIEEAASIAHLLKDNRAVVSRLDYSNQQFAQLGWVYVHASPLPPHYWISRDLAQALWQSSLKTEDIQPVAHLFARQFVVHFPNETIQSPTDGSLKVLHCLYCKPGEALKIGERQAASPNERLFYTATTTSGIVFAGILAIGDSDERPWDIDENFLETHGAMNDPETDQAFTHRLECLIYQILLVGQARPELVETGRDEAKFAQMSRSKQKKRLEQSNLPFGPNWIGKSYALPRERAESHEGSHASPRMHIRRGHWRRQPYGPKQEPQYRMRWIEPMVVGESAP